MQAHIMPTFISMVDQLLTSTWSQVGLVELAKCMRDWRRMTDTTVTLYKSWLAQEDGVGVKSYEQGSHAEHESNANLLLPGKLEREDL